jgi:hypothetical protein
MCCELLGSREPIFLDMSQGCRTLNEAALQSRGTDADLTFTAMVFQLISSKESFISI